CPLLSDCAAGGSGYFVNADFWCAWYSAEPEQVEYLVDWYFNEEFTMQYNSTVGKWTGFTPAGLSTAAMFNADERNIQRRMLEREFICVNRIDLVQITVEENMAEPSVTLSEITSSSHDTMLACSVYDFYPKNIRVTWHRNGQEVTSGVTISEVMTNGDWTYQVHSYLEQPAGRQHGVTCMVEHESLREPKIYDWGETHDGSYL
ncbi:SLA class II histocompatibility antigen, DQ haplotype D beta chain-like, partial [Plectropomus leopardus]|uniref:SLA class II histocompatibility antigen, DQ haplotype D beta chain-like n=1 Tax=Plectropomus leopardus TaxID=160734 RepID=UPI001C4B1B87